MSCLHNINSDNVLVEYIFKALEKNPNGKFSEAELQEISQESFELLKKEGLLQFHSKLKEFDHYYSSIPGDGDTDRIIHKEGNQYYATAVGVDRIPLSESQIIYYSFDTLAFAKKISEINQLSGESEEISKRIIYIGTESSSNTAIYLCLLSNNKKAENELRAIERANHDVLFFICPQLNISQNTLSKLQGKNKIAIFADVFENDWKIKTRLGGSRKTANRYGYKSNHDLTFLDQKASHRSYNVQIDNRDSFRIPYAKYALLLYMAIKLKENDEGWVVKNDTDQVGITDGENINHLHSLVSELRELFKGHVKNPEDFIETNKGRGQCRISVDPRNIKQPDTRWLKRTFNAVIKEVKDLREINKKRKSKS